MHPNYQLRHSHPVHGPVGCFNGGLDPTTVLICRSIDMYESISELVRDDCFLAAIDASNAHVYNISHLHAAYPM